MARMTFRAAAAIGTTALAAALAGTTATATPDRVASPTGQRSPRPARLPRRREVSQPAAKHGYKTYSFKDGSRSGVLTANCIPRLKLGCRSHPAARTRL
jgi:hypothetical protein